MFEKVEPITQEELDVLYTPEIQEFSQHLIDEQVELIKEKLNSLTTKDKGTIVTHVIDGTELEFHVRKVFEKEDYVIISTPVKGDDGKSLYNLSIRSKME